MTALPAPIAGDDARGLDPGALDADLGWALGVVFRAYVKAFTAAVDDLPGGPRGYQILAASARALSGTQLALAQQLGVDRTVMTYLLDDLARAGLVERRPDPADRRVRRVVATARGRVRLTDLQQRLEQAEDQFLAALTESERAALRQLLRRLATDANARDPVADACTAVEELRAADAAASGRSAAQPAVKRP
jgi:DNA-binding MarR family transcriptional regulator